MEVTCSRCHQTLKEGDCYCPVCGLPQIVYTAEASAAPGQAERPGETVRDASSIEWKSALRLALALAVPAGVFCVFLSQVALLGLLLIPAASAWVVALYMRSQRPAWITIGAGARIGLVTGILGSWTAAFTTGISLYAMRFWLHQGKLLDDTWQSQVNMASQQLLALGFGAQQVAENKLMLLSPQGRAGEMLFEIGLLSLTVLAFAIAGGALGARFLGRPRRTQNQH
jgi:hypothetical protein